MLIELKAKGCASITQDVVTVVMHHCKKVLHSPKRLLNLQYKNKELSSSFQIISYMISAHIHLFSLQ